MDFTGYLKKVPLINSKKTFFSVLPLKTLFLQSKPSESTSSDSDQSIEIITEDKLDPLSSDKDQSKIRLVDLLSEDEAEILDDESELKKGWKIFGLKISRFF